MVVPAIEQSINFKFRMPPLGEISDNCLGKGLGPQDSSLLES